MKYARRYTAPSRRRSLLKSIAAVGPEPLTLRVTLAVYDPRRQYYRVLPGQAIALDISSPELVDDLWHALEVAAQKWAQKGERE